MSVTVHLPSMLGAYTGQRSQVVAEGDTVGAVLVDVNRQHPGVLSRILDETGQLRRFVNIYVDDEDIRALAGLATPVAQTAQLSVIPSVAGG